MESCRDDQAMIEAQIEHAHKMMVARFVLPNMTIVFAIFVLTYFSWEPLTFFGFILATLLLLAHAYAWRPLPALIPARSHLIAGLACLADLGTGAALMLIVKPGQGPLFAAWTMLILGTQANTFRRRCRLPALGLSIAIGIALFAYLYPALRLIEHMTIAAGMLGIAMATGMTEQYWVASLRRHLKLQSEAHSTELAMSRLKTEATIGATTRTIIHELNNMITVLDTSSRMDDERAKERVRRAMVYIKKIHHLVMPDELNNDTRLYEVKQLSEDINLIISKYVTQNAIRWTTEIKADVYPLQFCERSGATYFIIHNLVKNACEALEGWHHDRKREQRVSSLTNDDYIGEILFEVQYHGDALELSISDNGPGMSEALVQSILKKSHLSSKSENRGLGLKFVMDECERNGFAIEIISHLNMGSRFTLRVPIAQLPVTHGPQPALAS